MKTKSFYHVNENISDNKSAFIQQILKNVTPISSAKFYQEDLINAIRKEFAAPKKNKFLSLFQSKQTVPKEYQNIEGLCVALLFIWYDYLEQGKNLVDVLLKGAPKPLLNQIIKLQSEITKRNFLIPADLTSQDELANLPESSSDPSAALQFLPKFAEIKNKVTMRNYSDELKSHIDALVKSGHHLHGLHTIGFIEHQRYKEKHYKAHIFGWTAINEGFLLFDANHGEVVLESIDHLKAYIVDKMMNVGSRGGPARVASDYCLSIEDYYTDADLVECQEAAADSSISPVKR